jgi:hypothetical protein
MNVHWFNRLKLVITNARKDNKDLRLGQYLYIVISGHKQYPAWDKNLSFEENRNKQDSFIANELFNIEAEELLLLVENFEKKQKKG